MRGPILIAMLIALSAPALADDDATPPAFAAADATPPDGADERPLANDESLKPLDETALGGERFSISGAARDDASAGLRAGRDTLQRPASDQGDVPIASPLLTAPAFMYIGRQ